jgi:hypothetical protein
MKKRLVLLTVVLVSSPAFAETCPMTAPVIESWMIDDYYTAGQWPTFNLTIVGPNKFIDPNDEPLANFLWAYSVHSDGTRVTVDVTPNALPSGCSAGQPCAQPWTLSQSQDADGCWHAIYNDEASLLDAPNNPSYCEPNLKFPGLCDTRGVEKSGWQITDGAGVSSALTDGGDCVNEGPPINPGGNRGALCLQAGGVNGTPTATPTGVGKPEPSSLSK